MKAGTSLTEEELATRVRQVDPTALLVPPRILRRVIKQHRGLGGLGLRVPHRKSYLIDCEALLRIATPAELGLPGVSVPAAQILLLPLPEASQLRRPALALHGYWRLLFHAAVHREYDRLRKEGRFSAAAVQDRINRVGAVVFEEAKEVLRQEHFLLDALDTPGVWVEFAAVYLELRHFDPHRLGQFFPAAMPGTLSRTLPVPAVDVVLAEDLDAEQLLVSTRPAGAMGLEEVVPSVEMTLPPDESAEQAPELETPGSLRARAEAASRQLNQVRAAILRQRAVARAPATQAGSLRGAARGEMGRLAHRLQKALDLTDEDRAEWADCLVALLSPAARGTWSVEARLLYDLQKVCLDSEKPLFAADLVEWVVSGFRRPIKRPLPDQPLVLAVKHLRSAAGRLPKARVGDPVRQRLGALIQTAIHATEARQRQVLRPKLLTALDTVGLVPGSAAERLSRDKLVEELLDRAGQRGFLSIGDLRDALARNRLKLPDLAGPIEFVTGDPLLRANRLLAVALDGIYRRGEIYLRWLQRLSSLFFGNPVGRFLTLFLLLPVLGSLFALKGIDVLSEELHAFVGTPEVHTFNPVSFVALALFLLPLIHLPRFRAAGGAVLGHLWRAVRAVGYDLPAAVLRLPLVRSVLQSRPYLIFYQLVGKPVAWAVPPAAVLYLAGTPMHWALTALAAWTVLVSVLINTRLGMVVEETATDALARTWQLVREDLLPGLFRWIVWLSKSCLEAVERVLYTVDEWLRFRQGEQKAAFVSKLLLGVVWFAVTYVIRFAINLLVEPQINPIKHFPVVTVSHKLLLPFALSDEPTRRASLFGKVFVNTLGWGIAEANFWAFWIVAGIPGIFGFLAWELKENWRLYRANQSPTLDALVIGSHGEEVIHLIRPGFHSGTLPRLYARLRRSRGTAEHKRLEGLLLIEEEVRRFVERDLIAVLEHSARWGGTGAVTLGDIGLATNRIQIEVCCPAVAGDSVVLEFSNRAGWLAAELVRPGWALALTPLARQALHDALAGFYKKAGVDLVWEDVRSKLPTGAVVEIQAVGLFAWLDADRVAGAVYDLRQPESPPRPVGQAVPAEMPVRAADLLYREVPLTWTAWVAQWELDRSGQKSGDRNQESEVRSQGLVEGVSLLPGVGS